jgi:large subunit ribosomal protein L2
MPSLIKLYKPTTPSRRKTSVVNYKAVLTTNKPYKKLLIRKKRSAGRNNTGKITIRHRGGGAKKMIRLIDFKKKFTQGFKVLTIEYDPNRSSFICLVVDLYEGSKHYILYTKGLEVGKQYGVKKEIQEGVKDKLKNLPLGALVSQIELQPKQGAKVVRSAGNYAQITAKEEMYVTLKLPSGEIRRFLADCEAVLGRIGKEYHELVRIGKAGRVRHKGFRPTVRGKVMNPVDHPHGGGEARNPIGLKYPKTPWGKHALGVKTRNKNKFSTSLILKRRAKKR